MINFILITLPFILIYGIITSYDDYKNGKIRNMWIFLALFTGLVIHIIYYFYLFKLGNLSNINYIYQYGLNILFSLFAGIIIWLSGFWSAGDAKLFFGYSALLPLEVYKFGYLFGFPSFVILINTFVPFFIFYFFRILTKMKKREIFTILKETFEFKFLLNISIFAFGFMWLLTLLFSSFKIFNKFLGNIFITLFFLFIIMIIFTHLFKFNLNMAAIILSILHIIFNYQTIFTFTFFKSFAITLLIFILLVKFTIDLGHIYFSEDMYIEDLKPGMIPLENITFKNGDYVKRKITPISFLSGLIDNFEKEKNLFHLISDGLVESEINHIKMLHSEGKFKPHSIKIGYIVPFAPFLFFGVLATIIFNGNMLISIVLKLINL